MQAMYFSGKKIYDLNNLFAKSIDNIDQRLTTDVNELTSKFTLPLLQQDNSVVSILSLLVIGIFQLFSRVGFNFKVIVVISYGVFCISLSMWRLQKVAAATAELQKWEGNFRHLHSRAAEFSESIAFYSGESKELTGMNIAYEELVGIYDTYLRQSYILSSITQFVQISSSLVAAAFFVWIFPCKSTKPPGIKFVQKNLLAIAMFIQSFFTIPKLLSSMSVAIGLLQRVGYLYEVLEENISIAPLTSTYIQPTADMIVVKNLVCRTPDNGKVLFDNISFSVKKGEPLIVMGPSGSGKQVCYVL